MFWRVPERSDILERLNRGRCSWDGYGFAALVRTLSTNPKDMTGIIDVIEHYESRLNFTFKLSIHTSSRIGGRIRGRILGESMWKLTCGFAWIFRSPIQKSRPRKFSELASSCGMQSSPLLFWVNCFGRYSVRAFSRFSTSKAMRMNPLSHLSP